MLVIGRGGGKAQLVDINNLLNKHALIAYRSAHALDEEYRLDIRYDLDPSAGKLSLVSEDIARVFLNLVGNTCYATDEKRREVEGDREPYTPTLWLSTERKEDAVEVQIRDNGIGIPTDAIDKIFNPFFTTKPTDKGTGLGLSLSSDIVRQHGGSITPVSQPGEYTEMIVSIPVSGDLASASE